MKNIVSKRLNVHKIFFNTTIMNNRKFDYIDIQKIRDNLVTLGDSEHQTSVSIPSRLNMSKPKNPPQGLSNENLSETSTETRFLSENISNLTSATCTK